MRIHVIASPPKMADSLLLGEMTSPRKRDIDSDKAFLAMAISKYWH
jgi:hypothetical protein